MVCNQHNTPAVVVRQRVAIAQMGANQEVCQVYDARRGKADAEALPRQLHRRRMNSSISQ